MQAKPCHRYVLIEQAGTPHTIRNAKSRRSSPPGTDQAFRSHFYLGRDRLKYAPKRKGDRYQRSFAHIPSVFSSTSLPTNIFNLPITQAPVVIAEAWPDMAGGRMRRAPIIRAGSTRIYMWMMRGRNGGGTVLWVST